MLNCCLVCSFGSLIALCVFLFDDVDNAIVECDFVVIGFKRIDIAIRIRKKEKKKKSNWNQSFLLNLSVRRSITFVAILCRHLHSFR